MGNDSLKDGKGGSMAKTAVNNAVRTTEQIAQQLQKRRENWTASLEQLPMPKAKMPDFPYANMAQAVKDEFALFDGGPDGAFALLVKGFKTANWRKAAEKNRAVRDEAAEGTVGANLAKRVAKKVTEEAAAE
jgi:hypothetical protein